MAQAGIQNCFDQIELPGWLATFSAIGRLSLLDAAIVLGTNHLGVHAAFLQWPAWLFSCLLVMPMG